MTDSEQGFHAEMHRVIRDSRAAGYNPSYFARMVEEMGGLAAARKLINDNTPSEGFTKLWEMKRLDLSVEAVALTPPWTSLFTQAERLKARQRRHDYGYPVARG